MKKKKNGRRAGDLDAGVRALDAAASRANARSVSEDARREAAAQGPQPSHRGPPNYIEGIETPGRVLRWTIDSLYLSYRGEISDRMLDRLENLKESAKAEEEAIQATAQLKIGDHLFLVAGHGQGRFRFVLRDERFYILISKGQKLPLAYAQISSEYLTSVGVEVAAADLQHVANTLGRVDGHAHVSRLDPCVDFTPLVPVDNWNVRQWIARARNKAAYWSAGDRFSGWKIGEGGVIQSRFYDKVLEIEEKSFKTYMFGLWAMQGWKDGDPVWRQEFQVMRAALNQFGIDSVAELLANLGGMWDYLMRKWLRLAARVETDSNRTRWSNHALWDLLAAVQWNEMPQPTLTRIRASGLPRDEQIFTAFPGYIASYMAREGITDWGEGLGGALHEAEKFHFLQGRQLADYAEGKARVKGRLLSTINNRVNNREDRQRIREEAEEYRRAKDGDDE